MTQYYVNDKKDFIRACPLGNITSAKLNDSGEETIIQTKSGAVIVYHGNLFQDVFGKVEWSIQNETVETNI